MSSFLNNDIVVLLGAGASVEADIPHSKEMIEKLEDHLLNNDKWARFQALYNYIRSSIYYSEGIHGRTNPHDVNYNIERLVDTLNEISMKNEHTLYPFVGAWNPTLVEVAGTGFELVEQLKQKIVNELMDNWLHVESYDESASYYINLITFQREYQFPLRVFTLNYDLCIERVCQRYDTYVHVERGFNDQRQWDWRQFDDYENINVNFYLYKLHGSRDWIWKEDILTYTDDGNSYDETNTAIIFGTSYKLEYRDPFLFLAYEFRKWTLEARLILVIGYGFGDAHINKIIHQALTNDEKRILLVVTITQDKLKTKNDIAKSLDLKTNNQIKLCPMKAKFFMNENLNLSYLKSFIQDDSNDSFNEVLS